MTWVKKDDCTVINAGNANAITLSRRNAQIEYWFGEEDMCVQPFNDMDSAKVFYKRVLKALNDGQISVEVEVFK